MAMMIESIHEIHLFVLSHVDQVAPIGIIEKGDEVSRRRAVDD
jgi:hypothetical protein